MPSTKIELNFNEIARISGLDDVARLFFSGNRNHQRVFLAIFIELKYSSDQFVPSFKHLCEEYGFSHRLLEIVRSKMRRMGLIDHVSRFNKKYGYREGWVFSKRFEKSLNVLTKQIEQFKNCKDSFQKKKDRDLFNYI